MLDIFQRTIIIGLICLIVPLTAAGQQEGIDPFAEWLVQLVYDNYPGLQAMDSEAKVVKEEIKLAHKEWLRAPGFNLGFNRSSNLTDPDQGTPNENFLFPRVSIGASVSLYPIFSTKPKIRAAEATYEAHMFSIDLEKSAIRKEVLTRYRDYQLAVDLLQVRSKMEEDADAHYRLLDRLFRSNEAEFKDYNDAYKTYQGSIEARLEAQANIDKTRIALEELLGISLAEAKRQWDSRG
ncbi:TolC family protein [Flavilitoribacter nigricans]|uniref:TolC family protein n=1 Tax=Flavilitoribacter nigricans (strain ATCC 23147 / DSM 23189 / NBRC 102662 / NCIMB 1420 / SS-2) TaxID=1122177 RepID=A0A2D0NJL9_FLAN2|nr:TolC family protein [Flavilitoribacter nigricans]PHN08399.1 hypothetical protein CRP01_00365 [Flavilitoribacter nigricans DSM 23189 = NBRC 102662]